MDAWTTEQITAKVESEGLGYMIEDGLAAERVADPELAELWRTAAAALRAVASHLDAQTSDEEDDPEAIPLSGPVHVSHTQLLCDTCPPRFRGRRHDEHGYHLVTSSCGGTLRLNLKGGRFGSDPEVYIEGSFEAVELLGWLRAIAPHAASHITQRLTFRDSDGRDHHASFHAPHALLVNVR